MSQKKTMYLIKTKYGAFKAAIWHDRLDKMYLVEVPSFNKTMTQGSTLADAKYMAKDLIELLCEVAFDDGKIVIDDNGRIAGRGKLAKLIGPVTVRTWVFCDNQNSPSTSFWDYWNKRNHCAWESIGSIWGFWLRMMNTLHTTLAAGRWHSMTLAEQLGNIGSEVHRARIAQEKGFEDHFHAASDRALELFDSTLADPRWKRRLFELGRMRDIFADTVLGGQEYNDTLSSLEPYFDRFALLAVQQAAYSE